MTDGFATLYYDPENRVYVECLQKIAPQMTDEHVQAALRILRGVYPKPDHKILRYREYISPERLADHAQEFIDGYFVKYPWRERPAESG